MVNQIVFNSIRLLVFSLAILSFTSGKAQDKWIAPESANSLTNTIDNKSQAIERGTKLYKSLCVACHGVLGNGKGVASAGLNPKPTDFTTAIFQKQSEGAVFWKLSKGRGVMATYENMLSEEDRWALVTYLKSLKRENLKTTNKTHKKNSIENTFLFTQLINAQTVRVLPKGKSEFTIQHRFGQTAFNADFINQFLGMDLSSNIRLAYARAITNRMYVELGRTKYGKIYDLNMKYKIISQSIDNKRPVSIAFFTDIAVMTDKFPNIVG